MLDKQRSKDLEAILLIVVVMLFAYLYSGKIHNWLMIGAIGLGFVGLFIPILSKWIVKAWMKLGEWMGAVMNRLVLGTVFYVFLTPIALLAKIFKKQDTLTLKKPKEVTYFVSRNHTYTADDLNNGW
jgi:hypothetical protein